MSWILALIIGVAQFFQPAYVWWSAGDPWDICIISEHELGSLGQRLRVLSSVGDPPLATEVLKCA